MPPPGTGAGAPRSPAASSTHLPFPDAVVLVARRGQVAYGEAFGYGHRESGSALTEDAILSIAPQTEAIVNGTAMILQKKAVSSANRRCSEAYAEIAGRTLRRVRWTAGLPLLGRSL